VNKKVFIFWSILVAAAFFRVWQSTQIIPPDVLNCVNQVASGTGRIAEEPERKESGQVLVVSESEMRVAKETDSCPPNLKIRMKTKLYPRFSFGDRVSFKGKLLKPANFESGGGRTFDFKGYLAKDDIFFEMKSAEVRLLTEQVRGQADEDVTRAGPVGLVQKISSALLYVKRKFVNNLEKLLGEPQAALAAGLVVGEKAALGKDLLNDFRAVGLIHIVVLSGYNITIVAYAMRRLLVLLPRVWGITIGGFGIVLFGIMVGGGATVVRSCLMAGVALSADLIRRDYSVFRALMFAGLLMLIQDPMILLHDPSFQLSFMATLGLILLSSPIEKRLTFIPDKMGMRGIVSSILATQIFVSPYILYMMGQISIIGAEVNILVLPFIPATMLFVFLAGSVGMIWFPLSQIFGWASYLLLSYELFMVQKFAALPFAAAQVPSFSGWFVVVFYALFGAIWLFRLFSMKSQFRLAKKSSM
jgi:competence protein ComEC